MHYEDLILRTAEATGHTPHEVEGVSRVYDTISRFAGMTIGEVEDAIAEIAYYENNGRKRLNDYHNLPPKLTGWVKRIIEKTGDVAKHFNPDMKRKNFESFARKFFEARKQPRDYLFVGVITYPELKFSVRNDTTYQVVTETYREDAA